MLFCTGSDSDNNVLRRTSVPPKQSESVFWKLVAILVFCRVKYSCE